MAYVSGTRIYVGWGGSWVPVLQVCDEKGVQAFVPYSDKRPEDHLESYRIADLIAAALTASAAATKRRRT